MTDKVKFSEVEETKQTVSGLCGLARKLGYKDPAYQLANSDGTIVGDLLCFFDDNPGACEAVIEWVLTNQKILNVVEDEDEEETDDEPLIIE